MTLSCDICGSTCITVEIPPSTVRRLVDSITRPMYNYRMAKAIVDGGEPSRTKNPRLFKSATTRQRNAEAEIIAAVTRFVEGGDTT